MSWEEKELEFKDLHTEIEQRCSSDILRVFKNNSGICLYKLFSDEEFNDVIMIFKLIINQEMNVKVISDEYEYKDFDKLTSWNQLNELIEKYLQNDESQIIFEEYDEIIEESNPEIDLFDTEEIIETIAIVQDEEIIKDESMIDDIQSESENPFQCSNCHIIFKNTLGLRHHSQSCSVKKSIVQKCIICDQNFSSNLQLRLHMKSHEEQKRLKCPYCIKTVVNNGSLQRHIKAIHLKQRHHKCSLCGKAFATSTMRSVHEKTHNRNSEVQKYISRDTNGTICYRCPNCNDVFDTSDHLKNHIEKNCYRPRKKRIYKYPCSYCGKQFITKIQAAKHYSDEHDMIIENPQKFCFECNAEVEDYVNHIRVHTCQFKCNYCGTKFLTEETCRQHEISKHSVPEDRPFHCSFESCNASFKTEHHLKSHINSIHDHNERLFRCEICNSKFAYKSLLTAHLRTHDKDSAIFKCKICGKSFKKLATLKNHSIALHQTDEIYECGIDECQVRYKFLQDLKVHRQNTHGLNLNIQKYFHEDDE